jgi:excinuclease ABC subunit A
LFHKFNIFTSPLKSLCKNKNNFSKSSPLSKRRLLVTTSHNSKHHGRNPHNKPFVLGVSGSGKSSLAFDTIYAEGQRRYVESSQRGPAVLERMDGMRCHSGNEPAISLSNEPTRNPFTVALNGDLRLSRLLRRKTVCQCEAR